MSTAELPFDDQYTLDDKYSRQQGRIFITGVQALVRLPLMQRARDLAAGLDTAGFISGYRGSPLGTYDMALWQAKGHLEQNAIRFEPGLNEDLAATAVWGSQQVNLLEGAKVDGVFGIWYGKGPGVDRSCDALKHANYAGAAKHGGVLALCGDDPGAKSSSIAHQSEQALVHLGMPILNPASVQDYLDFGLYGWALSRYSGSWVGMKCLTDTVESGGSVEVGLERVQVVEPGDFAIPQGGLNIGFVTGGLLAVEERLYHQRLPAVQAFVRANGLDRVAIDSPRKRLGIVTTGKAYLDVRQALEELGIDEQKAVDLGLSIYKVAMSWPLEPAGARAFCEGMDEVLVVEEKRPLIEEQLARILYDCEARPRLLGKRGADGAPLVSDIGELTPGSVEQALARWLGRAAADLLEGRSQAAVTTLPVVGAAGALARRPAFCSGCPHNTSTVVPDGSMAMGGIGCHGMVAWMPERRTYSTTHMGGEGATWIGLAPFTEVPHIFQNLGDGTYFHSGYLCVRANVAANTNITYKVLVNGAVAMTGGQPIEGQSMDGAITAPEIAHQLTAEGVKKIAIVSNEPDKYDRSTLPPGIEIEHRDRLDPVQKRMREIPGVTAIIYDQTCAAEARRLRKRGEFPDPDRRIVINERVCEGCGDCSVQSNCISVEPVETSFGRKRRINQSSCNKDFSCVKGHCPSFVSIYGGNLRKAAKPAADTGDDSIFEDLPLPELPEGERPFNVLVTGIGGTGVITVGALIGMAAHLEGKGVSVLDVTGLAQKNGPVTSHVRVAARPEDLHATRIASRSADLVLGCDIVVASGVESLERMAPGRTTVVANDHVAPTADFASHPDLDLSSRGMEDTIRRFAGDDAHFVSGTRLATALLGDAIATNLFLVGYAFQRGRLPVSLGALDRAIELNGRQIAMNRRAFAWGRLAAHDPDRVKEIAKPLLHGTTDSEAGVEESLQAIVEDRVTELTAYQNARYAKRYRDLVDRVAARERELGLDGDALAAAVARYYYKVLAVKDEFEVARLFSSGEFRAQIEQQFEGDYKVVWHPAPPTIPLIGNLFKDRETGRTRKLAFGPWFFPFLGLMAKGRFLRGTFLDFFNRSEHRQLERALIGEYERTVDELLEGLSKDNVEIAVEIASIPEHVRGYEDVKERHLEQAKSKERELLAAFRLRAPGKPETA